MSMDTSEFSLDLNHVEDSNNPVRSDGMVDESWSDLTSSDLNISFDTSVLCESDKMEGFLIDSSSESSLDLIPGTEIKDSTLSRCMSPSRLNMSSGWSLSSPCSNTTQNFAMDNTNFSLALNPDANEDGHVFSMDFCDLNLDLGSKSGDWCVGSLDLSYDGSLSSPSSTSLVDALEPLRLSDDEI